MISLNWTHRQQEGQFFERKNCYNRVLAMHYGFADEEPNFRIRYDIKYRIAANTEEE